MVLDILGLSYIAILALYILLRPLYTSLMKRFISITKSDLDDRLYYAVEKPIWYAVLLFLTSITLDHFFPNYIVRNLLLTATVALVGWSIIRASKVIISELSRGNFFKLDEKVRNTVAKVGENIVTALILFFTIIYSLSIWGVDVTPLLASAGLVGIVIGIALKDPIENLLSGILLLLDPPFRVGDAIRVGEYAGEVVEVGLRNTKIRTWDGDLVTVPNMSIVKTSVENFHLPDDKVRIHINVGVSYDADPEKVKEILLDIARSHPKVLKDPEPQVLFLQFGDYALLFNLRVWVRVSDKMTTLSDLNTMVWKRFKEEGIEIPFPVRTVYLKGDTRPDKEP